MLVIGLLIIIIWLGFKLAKISNERADQEPEQEKVE